MLMQMQVRVSKLGMGTIEDENGGLPKPWCKLYCLSDTFVDTDMFLGYPETEMSIVDPKTGLASLEVAQKIRAELSKQAGKYPLVLTVDCSMSISKKKQVISVCGVKAA